MKRTLLISVVLLISSLPVAAQTSIWGTAATPTTTSSTDNEETSTVSTTSNIQMNPTLPWMFVGGGLSLGFGDVEYYEIQPLVGWQLTRELSAGISALYRSRKDKRTSLELKTQDYGGGLFGRYKIASPLFVQAEYEYINYEYYRTDFSKTRADFSSFMAGAGISQPLGSNSSFYAAALYNFSYDKTDSPYDNPWIYRVGVSFGF